MIGFVGRRDAESVGGEKVNFRDKEMCGREGLEAFYDSYLRGSQGEIQVTVDARGFAVEEKTVSEARRGPDLRLSMDVAVQRAVERQLRGERGACAVIDPRDGSVLALASAPAYDLNLLVPQLSPEINERLFKNARNDYRNRACFETYAPGSTFKPVTALAGLGAGVPPGMSHDCTGVFVLGGMRLHCARRWGHGPIDMRHALRESCNTYFCSIGFDIGTNALFSAARAMGLGAKTGIDFPQDSAGVVPSAEYKRIRYNLPWYAGDLAHAAIGQGQLLVTPLQMARVAGAIGTGCLVRPRLGVDAPVERAPLPFPARDLAVVREGMRMVVDGGTGKRAGEGVAAAVAGKTGTSNADIDRWFIGYTPDYVCGVWYGYVDTRSLGYYRTNPACTVFDTVMNAVYRQTPELMNNKFNRSDNVIKCLYCRDSGMLASTECTCDARGNRIELGYFKKGTEPQSHCDAHILVNYDAKNGGVVDNVNVFDAENVKKTALVKNYSRSFPCQIYITDAQYSYRYLSPLVPPSENDNEAYYQSLEADGEFFGISDTSVAFNRASDKYNGDFSEKDDESGGAPDQIYEDVIFRLFGRKK